METQNLKDKRPIIGIYEQIIKDALPNAMIEYVSNFDDDYQGWEITPAPGILIKLMIEMDDSMIIKILLYKMDTYYGELRVKDVYSGTIPCTENSEPDYKFIQTILKNWMYFGHKK